MLPEFAVDALVSLVGESEPLAWVTPHSFRRTVATVVRDGLGVELAQQQLSHPKLSTTEAHYLQRHTRGPDVPGESIS